MKNSGMILRLTDNRIVIVYDRQPCQEEGKIVLNLVDEKYNIIKGEDGKAKVIIKDIRIYLKEMKAATLIGYID